MVTVAETLPWVEMAVYHLLAYAMVEAQEADLSCSTLRLTWLHQCFAGSTWGKMRLLEVVEAAVPLICLGLHCQSRLQSPVLSPLLACPQGTAL